MGLEVSAHQARKVVPSTALHSGMNVDKLSRVLAAFLASSESNYLTVQVFGKQKREVGLDIAGCHNASTSERILLTS